MKITTSTSTLFRKTGDMPFVHVGCNVNYRDVIEGCFGWEVYDFLILDDDGGVIGGGSFVRVGRKLISMPHMSLGSWWCEGDSEEAFALLGQHVRATLGIKDIELRSLECVSKHYDNRKVLSVMEIDEDDILDKIISSNIRRKVRKAHSKGVEVEIADITQENIDSFFTIYYKKIHQLHSFPLTKKYINTLLSRWSGGKAILFFVLIGKKRVGAAINISINTFVENILFATDPRYYSYYITDALHYGMISHAINSGMRHYSFGRSTIDSGVYRYKSHWPVADYSIYRNFYRAQKADFRYSQCLKFMCSMLPYRIRISAGRLIERIIY